MAGGQLFVVAIGGVAWAVVAPGKSGPVAPRQDVVQLSAAKEPRHSQDLLVFAVTEGGDHVLRVGMAGETGVVAQNLSQAPRRALERGPTVQGESLEQAVVLMGAPRRIRPACR